MRPRAAKRVRTSLICRLKVWLHQFRVSKYLIQDWWRLSILFAQCLLSLEYSASVSDACPIDLSTSEVDCHSDQKCSNEMYGNW